MQIAVLGSTESWYLNDLRRAAAERHSILPILWRDLSSSLDSEKTQVRAGQLDLSRLDAMLVRTMPAASLEQVIFRMDLLGRLQSAGTAVINPPRAIEIAIDKYLALARLQAAGLPVPRTIVCQTPDDALAAFDTLGRDVVVKPIFGSEGKGLIRIDDLGLAERVFGLLAGQGAVLYLQEFLRHPGWDIRVLVIGKRLLAIRRHATADWRTNLARGGTALPVELDATMRRLAVAACRAVGATLAGVDLLSTADGRTYVIEVNAVPGWKGLAAALRVDVAALVIDYLESLVSSGPQTLD